MSEKKKDLPYQEIQNIHNKSYIQYTNYIRLYNALIDYDYNFENPKFAKKLCEKTGKIIRSTTYAACSLDKIQAQKFAKGKDSVLLIIQVPPLELAPHFKSLKEHSIYKDEMEVLFACYSAFKVEKVREVGKCEVILTAVDNVNRHENKDCEDDDWLCSF
ncbi:hypothetical protein ABK040_007964 [Willaertia magna]